MTPPGYRVQLRPGAVDGLQKPDRKVGQRILDKLKWVAARAQELRHETLSAQLQGFYKLRVGDYRVIYTLERTEGLVDVYFMGHRREVYKFKP